MRKRVGFGGRPSNILKKCYDTINLSLKFYPDEEENPEYWWDVELDDVRYEVYSIEKDEDDPYNQYREWEGRENKVASFQVCSSLHG